MSVVAAGGPPVVSYDEVRVERRRIVVTERQRWMISAWHGGRAIAENGGWGHPEQALREAEAWARRFGVDAGSTLSIRICRETVRLRDCPGDPSYRSRETVVGRVHVNDVAAGPVTCGETIVAVQALAWLSLREGADPGPYLACHAGLEIDGVEDRALFAGYGHGAPSLAAPRIVDPAGAPPSPAGAGRVWHQVGMPGRIPLMIAPGGEVAAALRALDARIAYDFTWCPERNPDDPRFFSARPTLEALG